MQHLKQCINPKVIAGLGVAAVGVWVLAPGAFAAALPLLIVAICPLSMVGMMYMMRAGQGNAPRAAASPDTKTATEPPVEATMEGQESGRTVEALRARVFELEARLSAESRRDETRPAEPAVNPVPAAAGPENSR